MFLSSLMFSPNLSFCARLLEALGATLLIKQNGSETLCWPQPLEYSLISSVKSERRIRPSLQ